ncbi:monocarboxylate transporter 9 [Danaus plexippus]|uniref:Monocarboxylate transporter n=1 Tax=Danaus plexippus plexippus TaxID=278856 RepID=A0A212FP05_DANPL|nr:monocarboxylate transporter 9 [Danaus plexippus]OWR55439.1 monocarboxylate transporter [Danaus plexippus plexippus]
MTVEKSKGTEKKAPATRKVAPDGGWAWMVCLGVSLVNFSTRSLEPSFGLLFKDLLDDLGVHTTGASVIASTLDSVVNFSGFFVGPVIKTFSYRKVCFVGSLICALGLLFTAPANSMGHILATYSIIGGFGVGLASSSSFVSLNHYFSKKRGQAVGLSMAGTGFGLMVMPQLVKILLGEFGFRWTVVILGGLAFHAVLGSCLLQPIKRHLKEEPVDCEMQLVKEMECINESDEEADDKFEINPLVSHPMPKLPKQRSHTNMNHPSVRTIGLPRAKTYDKPLQDFDNQNTPGLTTAASVAAMQRVISSGSMSEAVRKRKVSVISNISNMDFTGSYLQLYIDAVDEDTLQMKSIKKNEPEEKKVGFIKKFISLMDLDLLKDWSFLNLLLGLSLFWSGELQFRMLTPFFIRSLGYTMNETAFCLSMTAITDICVRLVLPPIFDRTNITKKMIFFISAFFLAATRSVLAEQSEWVPLMIWLSICGFFRGMCLSNFTLTISEYCPLEKLPAAFGLHMVSKGVFVVIIGPLIGYVRDYTGSFATCIHVQNALIMSCVLVWGIEYALAFTRRRKVVQI